MQILLYCGSIDSKALDGYVARLKKDFADAGSVPLADTLKRINVGIRKFSLELRSMRSKDDDEWVTYYGLVNTEDDDISKAHGIKHIFDELELRFFSTKLMPKLMEQKYMSTDDVTSLESVADKKAKVHSLLPRLEAAKWLSRGNDKGYWELGPRAFLELKSHLESLLRMQGQDEDVSEEQRAADFDEAKAQLPQILYY